MINVASSVAKFFFASITTDRDKNFKLHARKKVVEFLLETAQGELLEFIQQTANEERFIRSESRWVEFMTRVMKGGLGFQVYPLVADQPIGYTIRVMETIHPEALGSATSNVFEVDGVHSRHGSPKSTDVLEWFSLNEVGEVLFAVETRMETPINMYSGLATRGCNLQD